MTDTAPHELVVKAMLTLHLTQKDGQGELTGVVGLPVQCPQTDTHLNANWGQHPSIHLQKLLSHLELKVVCDTFAHSARFFIIC